ncbi:MAG: type II toxin-antitoxin system RelE/ParE family toxin [Hyphomicrobiales bacterium]|nr:type II toxin-antitoxin system RelE/ParE family toxin [Hyphomicrobiales bacterium]
MKIVFLSSSIDDLEWMKRYYDTVFPAGKLQAAKRYRNALAVIRDNPKAGAPSEVVDSLREHPIPNTPFRRIYQLTGTEIRILHVKDQRSNKPIRRPK